MKTTRRILLLTAIVGGFSIAQALGQAPPLQPTAPAPNPDVVAKPPSPQPPPSPPPAGDLDEAVTLRLRNLTSVRSAATEYDGAIMRIRQRAQRHERARNPEEALWKRGVDNLSFDSMTGRPVGISFFTIKY